MLTQQQAADTIKRDNYGLSPSGCGESSSFARPGPVLSNLSINSLKLSASNSLPSATTPQVVKPSPLASPSPLSSLQIISPPAGFPIPGPQVEKVSTQPPVSNLERPAISAAGVFPVLQGWNDSSHSLVHEPGTTIVGTPIRNSIAQSTAITLSVGANIGSPALRNSSESPFVSSGIPTVHIAPALAPDTQISATASTVPTFASQAISHSQPSTSSENAQPATINRDGPALAPDAVTSPSPIVLPTTLQTIQTTQLSEASQTPQPSTTSQNALADVAAVFGAKFEQAASTLAPIPAVGANIPEPTITTPASVLDILPASAMMFKTLEATDFHMVASMLEVKYSTVSTEPLND